MTTTPDHRTANDRFCLTSDGVRTWADFLTDVGVARGLAGDHDALVSLVRSRYGFAVTLSAAMLDNVPVLLPPSQAQNAVNAVMQGWTAPGFLTQDWQTDRTAPPAPGLDQATGPIHVFTSGSTGKPATHLKNWTILAGGAKLTSDIIERAGLDRSETIIAGTTPHQHMYGLEAAMFTALAHGWCLDEATIFYPDDIHALCDRAAAAGIRNIALATSPAHLRFLAPAIQSSPMIRCVISSTAPLHGDLAHQIEDGDNRQLFEIYGSTETGSLAWRRTSVTDVWQSLAGFELTEHNGTWSASAPHLPDVVPMNDILERRGPGFRLVGRKSDMVQIAGKRQSLAALNAALGTLPEISDGVVISHPGDGQDQLAIFVVPLAKDADNPDRLHRVVRKHMLRHVDPIFVPRRVHFTDALPRADTGKLRAEDLQSFVKKLFQDPDSQD